MLDLWTVLEESTKECFYQPNHEWGSDNKRTDTEHFKTYKCACNIKAKVGGGVKGYHTAVVHCDKVEILQLKNRRNGRKVGMPALP